MKKLYSCAVAGESFLISSEDQSQMLAHVSVPRVSFMLHPNEMVVVIPWGSRQGAAVGCRLLLQQYVTPVEEEVFRSFTSVKVLIPHYKNTSLQVNIRLLKYYVKVLKYY